MLEKKDLEEKVASLTVEITPSEDELEDTKDLKTQAKLVAHFQLVMDDAQAAFEGRFKNAVKQMHVLNPGVELNTSGMGVNYYMVVGKILVPNYLKEFVAQPTSGPAQLSPVAEGEVEG